MFDCSLRAVVNPHYLPRETCFFNVHVAEGGEHMPVGFLYREEADRHFAEDVLPSDKGAYRIVVKPKGEMK